jgi:hypothetical protein
LTALFLCNMSGSDKQVFVVGRTKGPRCFRGKHIPLPYFANQKAWMTGTIWTTILRKWDSTLVAQNRTVLLLVDNAACHKLDDGVELLNIRLQFLPPNTTSLIQPLDQGIIRCVKVYYRQRIVRKQLNAVEQEISIDQFSKQVDVLQAMHMLKRSWWLVTPTTIRNCFRKAGFWKPTEVCHQFSHVIVIKFCLL